MPLHLDNLRDSVEALSELLTASEDEARMGQLSEIERVGIRAGVVKHFEITYELSWKLMARWLNTNVGADTADGVTNVSCSASPRRISLSPTLTAGCGIMTQET